MTSFALGRDRVSRGCSHAADDGTTVALRGRCTDGQLLGRRRVPAQRGSRRRSSRAGTPRSRASTSRAKAALDAVERAGPLDHKTQRHAVGAARDRGGLRRRRATATTAFDMLLALDPAHFLSYELSPKATLVFEKTLDSRPSSAARPRST